MNSTFQVSNQNINDTEPNIINSINPNIEQINIKDINVIKLNTHKNDINNNNNNLL